ncbi:CGNR zinc finger domain-containing protein [Streptomyces sp. G45]|uniref:CGNR zinc finger domain-containing protein n=1 Tax=Streptomyces sp. G45 TaxID=3406627 RepID=UPI003C1BCC98
MKFDFSDYAWGAAVATGLVNTSAEVRSIGEVLTDPDALARFLDEHGLRPSALGDGGSPGPEDLAQVHALRQEVRDILETESEAAVVASATALIGRGGMGLTLTRDDRDQWQWSVTTSPGATLAEQLAVLVGTGLLGTLRTLSLGRFRHCTAPDCNGMFVDTSKAGRRRYCMPEVCGNRRNVANYRARRQTAAAPSRRTTRP